jgi:hypothetical protein
MAAPPPDVRKVSDLPFAAHCSLGLCPASRTSKKVARGGAQPLSKMPGLRKVGDLPHIRRHSRGSERASGSLEGRDVLLLSDFING